MINFATGVPKTSRPSIILCIGGRRNTLHLNEYGIQYRCNMLHAGSIRESYLMKFNQKIRENTIFYNKRFVN